MSSVQSTTVDLSPNTPEQHPAPPTALEACAARRAEAEHLLATTNPATMGTLQRTLAHPHAIATHQALLDSIFALEIVAAAHQHPLPFARPAVRRTINETGQVLANGLQQAEAVLAAMEPYLRAFYRGDAGSAPRAALFHPCPRAKLVLPPPKVKLEEKMSGNYSAAINRRVAEHWRAFDPDNVWVHSFDPVREPGQPR